MTQLVGNTEAVPPDAQAARVHQLALVVAREVAVSGIDLPVGTAQDEKPVTFNGKVGRTGTRRDRPLRDVAANGGGRCTESNLSRICPTVLPLRSRADTECSRELCRELDRGCLETIRRSVGDVVADDLNRGLVQVQTIQRRIESRCQTHEFPLHWSECGVQLPLAVHEAGLCSQR